MVRLKHKNNGLIKRSVLLSFIFSIITVTVVFCYRYFKTKYISFELVKEIPKPTEDYDNSQFIGFDYIQNEESLMFFMVDWYKTIYPPSIQKQGYDSTFAGTLGKELDFKKYDYIITYQKQLKSLGYSPYLAKEKDNLGKCEKEKPLIPTFDTEITDKVYIYQIEKNNTYRAPGP